MIAGQELENPLENAALGPSVEALIDDLPVAEALGRIPPRDAGSKPEENGFDEQALVRRRTAYMAFAATQNILDPVPLVVARSASLDKSGRAFSSDKDARAGRVPVDGVARMEQAACEARSP